MLQSQNIQVFARCRPLSTHEKRSVVEVTPERREIRILDRNTGTSNDTKNFVFDQVFTSDALQIDVYNTIVRPLIDQVLLGFNCTVFAYGQTGTGKTFTIEGERSDENLNWEEDPHCGIIPRAIIQLFDALKEDDKKFTVRVSFLELYNEDTYDLLSPVDDITKLKISDDLQKGSVFVGGLEEIIVQSKSEIYEILKRGSAKRQTAATLLNACSSRSHTIFSVTVHIREGTIEGEELLKIGKLNLVDLAGSENIGRSGAQDKRAREAGNINQSLLTLGRVITALVEKRPHIPYRESKLTRLLQDSLGGKTKTSIIATVSPAIADLEDTLSTLDYASRAKKITNKPEMNQRLTKKALLREYTQEIERLRRDLQATREKNGVYIEEENYKDMCKQLSAGNVAIQEKEDRLSALQNEIEKSRKLFEDFTNQYEQTKAELSKTKEDCEKQKRLIDAQKETEKKLASQAAELIHVAEIATNDNFLLHGKKERIENILKENRASIDKYHPKVRDGIARLESVVDLCAQERLSVIDSFQDKIKHECDSNDELVSKISNCNKLQIDNFRSQFNDHKASVETLRSQFDRTVRLIEHHEILAKEYREQSISIKEQIENHNRLALNCESQAKNLQDSDPILRLASTKLTNARCIAQKFSEKIGQLTSTADSALKRELGSFGQGLDRFFTREIKEDVRTGLTPQKKNYEIPRLVIRTSLCDSILEGSEELTGQWDAS